MLGLLFQAVAARSRFVLLFAAALVLLAVCSRSQAEDDLVPIDLEQDIPSSLYSAGSMPLELFGYGALFHIRHFAGDAVDTDESFTTAGIFNPFWNVSDAGGNESIAFLDGRFVLQNDTRVAGNLGLGWRRYLSGQNRVWGASFWYDAEDTHRRTFNQIGGRVETYGRIFDGFANFYFPVGDTEKRFGFSETSSEPRFQGTNVIFDRFRFDEVAMMGADMEVGGHVPMDFYGLRELSAFGGWYHYDSDAGPKIDGFSTRLGANLGEQLSVQLRVTHDSHFDTSVQFGVTWEFTRFFTGAPDVPSVREHLGTIAERNYHVVVTEQAVFDPVVALFNGDNGDDGRPLNIIHVNSDPNFGTGAANRQRDGSVENPFLTLSDAEGVSEPGDIFFLHTGSVFDAEETVLTGTPDEKSFAASITLQPNQRFLGEGEDVIHLVETANMGTVPIPRANLTDTATPVLKNSPAFDPDTDPTVPNDDGFAIKLADGVEVSNIDIEQAQGIAILGDGLGADNGDGDGGVVNIDTTTVDGAHRGLDIRNSSGEFLIESIEIANTQDDAILLTDNAAGSTFQFTGTTEIKSPGEMQAPPFEDDFTPDGIEDFSNGGVGISIQGGGADVTFEDVKITDRSGTGISIGRSEGPIDFTEPLEIKNPNGTLDEAIAISNTSGDVTFAGVTLTDLKRDTLGQPLIDLQDNANTTTFGVLNIINKDDMDTENAVGSDNGIGLRAIGIGALNIGGGRINVANAPAIDVNGIAQSDITFQSISVQDAKNGIIFETLDEHTGTFTITGVDAEPGSGGQFRNVDTGVRLNNVEGINLNFLDFEADSSSLFGVRAFNTDSLIVNASMFDGMNVDEFEAISVFSDSEEKDGTPLVFTGNTITGTGAAQIGINVVNNGSAQGAVRLDDLHIELSGDEAVGINLEARGAADTDATPEMQLDLNLVLSLEGDNLTLENFNVPTTQEEQNTEGSIVLIGQQKNSVLVPDQSDALRISETNGGFVLGDININDDDDGINLLNNVIFVDSEANGNGSGTMEDPFKTLTKAKEAGESNSIFFLFADSMFREESITLNRSQRLLGEGNGVNHFIDTRLGRIAIKRENGNPDGTPPVILDFQPSDPEPHAEEPPDSSSIAAITLDDDVAVASISNIEVRDTTGIGILGDRIDGEVMIDRTKIDGAEFGLDIRNSTGNFTIDRLTVQNTSDDAILLTDNLEGSTFNFTGTEDDPTHIISPGEMQGGQSNGGIGISIAGGAASITFDELKIDDRSSTAIAIGRSEGPVNFTEPLNIENPMGTLDQAIAIANSSGNVTFSDVIITDTDRINGPGQPSVDLNDNDNVISFDSLTITADKGGAIRGQRLNTLNIRGGDIASTEFTAIDLRRIQQTDITLNSVSATDTKRGIIIFNEGSVEHSGRFFITGVDAKPGSGGKFTNVDRAIFLRDVENVSLNFLNIVSTDARLGATERPYAVRSENVDGLVVNASKLSSQADGWIGVSVFNVGNIDDDEEIEEETRIPFKQGTPVTFTGNEISGDGDDQIGIAVESDNASQMTARFGDLMVIALSGANSTGLDLRARAQFATDTDGTINLIGQQRNTVDAETVIHACIPEDPDGEGKFDNDIFGTININDEIFPSDPMQLTDGCPPGFIIQDESDSPLPVR